MRDLHIKRLYSLGDYKNIEISSTIEIPDDVDNLNAQNYYTLLLVDIEEAYRKYLEIIRVAGTTANFEDAMAVLESVRSNVILKLKGIDDPESDTENITQDNA